MSRELVLDVSESTLEVYMYLFLTYPFIIERGSQLAQAALDLFMYPRMSLNC